MFIVWIMGMPGTSRSAETGDIFGFNSELISLCPPELYFVVGFFVICARLKNLSCSFVVVFLFEVHWRTIGSSETFPKHLYVK